jgi:hypothetical protein
MEKLLRLLLAQILTLHHLLLVIPQLVVEQQLLLMVILYRLKLRILVLPLQEHQVVLQAHLMLGHQIIPMLLLYLLEV